MNILQIAASRLNDDPVDIGNRNAILQELVDLTGEKHLVEDRLVWLDNRVEFLQQTLQTLNGE